MAKSSSNAKSAESGQSVEIMAEPERLAAISLVRGAYAALEHSFDNAETNQKRVRLLAVWRDLVEMREADPSLVNPLPLDALLEHPIDNEPPAEEPLADEPPAEERLADEPLAEERLADEPLADEPPADEPLADEPLADEPIADEPITEVSIVEEPIAEEANTEVLIVETSSPNHEEVLNLVEIELRNEGNDVVIAALSSSSHHEAIVIEEIPPVTQPPDLIVSDIAAVDVSREGPIRIRLKLLKPGFVHGTVLPQGTVVSTFAADAEELISSGTAERLLIQNESEDD
jgi:hypothetical protein